MNGLTVKILVILLMGFTFLGKLHAHGDHSSPCSGPHKNDPVCLAPPPPLPPPAISVNSATVDWLNEKIIIGGENFTASTTITLAGLPATIGSQTANQIEIPFDLAIGGTPKGNHNLIADDGPSSSTSSLSLFVKAEIIDQAMAGCPCEADWSTELAGLWGASATECFEITGGPGNPEDIAGTVLTDSTDPVLYPHFPIGAAFTAEPVESVCQLTKVSSPLDPAAVTDLVKTRINRLQQGICRTALVNNVCSTITPAP